MTALRLVCTHDALELARTLSRLLAAEEHEVALSYGRNSLDELALAETSREAVVLIWSRQAATTQYIFEWAKRIAPARVIDIAAAPDAARRGAIDFHNWRGDRGSRAWHALNDRLRAIARGMEPAKPPPIRAALALGVASAAAVGVAFVVRVNEGAEQQNSPVDYEEVAATYDTGAGVGGAIMPLEPASLDDIENIATGPFGARLPPLPAARAIALTSVPSYDEVELRNERLLERLEALVPRRDDSQN